MRFGRLEKRREELRYDTLISTIEQAMDAKVPKDLRRQLLHGPEEVDLVNSGLDETMSHAYREIRETYREEGFSFQAYEVEYAAFRLRYTGRAWAVWMLNLGPSLARWLIRRLAGMVIVSRRT